MATELSRGDPDRGHDDSVRQGLHRPVGFTGDERLETTVARFAEQLEADGLHAALGYLNSRTRFRFTGAYRFAPPLLCSIEIFDREYPTLALSAEVEMRTTYCSIVGAADEALAVDDAEADSRVRASRFAGRMGSRSGHSAITIRAPESAAPTRSLCSNG